MLVLGAVAWKIDRRGSGRASPKATLLRSRVNSVPDLAKKLAFGSLSSRSTRRNLTFSRYRQCVLEIDISKFVTSFIVCKFLTLFLKLQTPTFLTRKGPFSQQSPVRKHSWSREEDRALVEFIGVARTDPSYEFDFESSAAKWPCFRAHHKFWKDAAAHIKEATRSNFLLTG